MESRRIFSWVEVLVFFLTLLLSILLKDFFLLIPLALIFILSLLHLKDVLGVIVRVRFWILVISPILICAFLVGPRDLDILWIKLSSAGVVMGLNMAIRALCMILAVTLVISKVSLARIISFFEARRLKGLGLSVGVAYNMLFTLARTARIVFETLRLRGMVRRHPLKALRLFIVAVISSALQHADDIVNAATVRAFDVRK